MVYQYPPVTVASGRASPCTRHVLRHRSPPHYCCCYYWRCLFAAWPFTGCGAIRAAQRFVAQEMPWQAATARKMRWPLSGNGVMQPLRVVFCVISLRQQLDPTLRLNKGFAHVTARAQSMNPSGMSGVRPIGERHPTADQRNTVSAKRRFSSRLPGCGRRTGLAGHRYVV